MSSVVSGRCSTLTLQYIRSIVGLFLEATTPFSVNTPALMTRMYPIDSRPRREEFTIYFYDPCSACWTWMAWVPVGMYLGIFSIEGSRFENVDIFNTACPVVAPVSQCQFYQSVRKYSMFQAHMLSSFPHSMAASHYQHFAIRSDIVACVYLSNLAK